MSEIAPATMSQVTSAFELFELQQTLKTVSLVSLQYRPIRLKLDIHLHAPQQQLRTELKNLLSYQVDVIFYVYIRIIVVNFRPGSSVGIATDYWLDGPGTNPGRDEIFRPSRPALGPTQPPV